MPSDSMHETNAPSDGGDAASSATSFVDDVETCAPTPPLLNPFDDHYKRKPFHGSRFCGKMEDQNVRYPKRKREQVKYYDSDDEGEQFASDDEEEVPKTKKAKTSLPKKQKPLPKHKVFPFMELPPELRNHIYELALADPKGHYIIAERRAHRRVGSRVTLNTFKTSGHGNGRYNKWHRRQTMFQGMSEAQIQEDGRKNILRSTLLRVNKAIYHEAVGYLYGNKFTFADTNALHDFLTAIGPRMRARLREIEVAEWGYSSAHKAMNYPAMSLLADAVNLERIWLNICHWERTLGQKIFRDCATFMIAYGLANGDKEAALKILQLPSSEDEKRPWQLTKTTRTPSANKKIMEAVRAFLKVA